MFLPDELQSQAASWADLKRWERRELGQNLRQLGLSYREIGEIIPVPKGTLSAWCRDVPLTDDQKMRLGRLGRSSRVGVGAMLRRRNLERVEDIRAKARAEAYRLSSNINWAIGVVAYWAEGDKRSKHVGFSNSDPALISIFIDWAIEFLGVSRDQFAISLHLHSGQDDSERKEFWSSVTGLPLSQFGSTFVKPEGTGHRKNVLYNGTATIRIRRSGDLLHRVLGWIDVLRWSQAAATLNSRAASSTG